MGTGEAKPTGAVHQLSDPPLDRCPSCASTRLVAVADDGALHFLCDDCARCWNVELGYVSRVNPRTCAHCAHYERCATVFAIDHGIGPKRNH